MNSSFSTLNLSSFGHKLFLIPTDAFYNSSLTSTGKAKTSDSYHSLSTSEGSLETAPDHHLKSPSEEEHTGARPKVPFTSLLACNWRRTVIQLTRQRIDQLLY